MPNKPPILYGPPMVQIKELDPTEDTISKLYALHDSKSITLTADELNILQRISLTENKISKDRKDVEDLWSKYAEVPRDVR
jgi:hypothetical protein